MTDAKFKGSSDKEWVDKFLDKNSGLEEYHIEFVLWIEQYFLRYNELPKFEQSDDLDLDLETWQKYWMNNAVRTCLRTRGIPLQNPHPHTDEEAVALPKAVLSGRQLQCINYLLDYNKNIPDHKKLKELGISTKEYQRWRADPVFLEYFHERAKKAGFLDLDDDAYRAFADNVRMGDMKAIQMLFEMKGIYKANDPQITQFRVLLQQVIDAIQQEVKDAATLERLSHRILTAVHDSTAYVPPAIDKSIPSILELSEVESAPVGGISF